MKIRGKKTTFPCGSPIPDEKSVREQQQVESSTLQGWTKKDIADCRAGIILTTKWSDLHMAVLLAACCKRTINYGEWLA